MKVKKRLRKCAFCLLALGATLLFAPKSYCQAANPPAPASKSLSVVFGTLHMISTAEVQLDLEGGGGKITTLTFQMRMSTIQMRATTRERVGIVYHVENTKKVADKIFPLAGYQEPPTETVGGVGGVASVEVPATVQQQIATEVMAQNSGPASIDLQEAQAQQVQDVDPGSKNQGKGGLPTAPPSAQAKPTDSAYAAVAPPPVEDQGPRLFLVTKTIVATQSSGQRCTLSPDDVLGLIEINDSTALVSVLRNGRPSTACPVSVAVRISLTALRSMDKSARQAIDNTPK